MAIDPNSIGAVTEPMLFEWTDRDTLLYAIGVGAGTGDLAFTTENSHGIDQQVLPTYAVICCPAFGAAAKVGTFNPAALLHGSQGIRLHAPLPAAENCRWSPRSPTSRTRGGQERHRCACLLIIVVLRITFEVKPAACAIEGKDGYLRSTATYNLCYGY